MEPRQSEQWFFRHRSNEPARVPEVHDPRQMVPVMVAVSEALAELDPRVQPLLVGVVHASLDGQQDAVEMPSHCLRKDPELLGPLPLGPIRPAVEVVLGHLDRRGVVQLPQRLLHGVRPGDDLVVPGDLNNNYQLVYLDSIPFVIVLIAIMLCIAL